MARGDAQRRPAKGLGRIFQCFAPGAEAAIDKIVHVAAEPERKSPCLVVLGAGSSNFNGVYLAEARQAKRNQAPSFAGRTSFGGRGKKAEPDVSVYRKIDGPEAVVYFSGWWLFNTDGGGSSYYGVKADGAGLPPPESGWCIKHGESPAPRTELFASLEEVPRQLQEGDAHESCALEVSGAGSLEYDGIYHVCGVNQGKFCYRKEDGAQTIMYYKGWWLMNKNGAGDSAYGLRCPESDAMPPSGAAWGFKSGKAPSPVVITTAERAASEESEEHVDSSIDVSCKGAESSVSTVATSTSADVSLAHSVSQPLTLTACADVILANGESQPLTLSEGDALDEAVASSPRDLAEEVVFGHAEQASYALEPATEDPEAEQGVDLSRYPGRQNHDDMPDAAVQAPQTALEEIIEEDEMEAAVPQGEVSVQRALDDAAAARTNEAVLPARGFVSQRVSAFAQLSLNRSASPRNQPAGLCAESMPDAGMVSERIQQHQRFISSISQHPKRVA